MSRARGALARPLRGQLRLRVMAGVVAVTLIALVAFDASAVAIMRRHLLNQTDSNLRVALNLTRPRLNALLAVGTRPGTAGPPITREPASGPPGPAVPALPGLFDIRSGPWRPRRPRSFTSRARIR
jgi:hypothetical protein